jgi:ubiquinone/menaquinone biosynthesis C-methylase UbiE
MDARDLKYEDNIFDLVIDKSTTDSILCGEKSFLNAAIVMKEVQRVLKTGGIYIVISYGSPENRVLHLVLICLIRKENT